MLWTNLRGLLRSLRRHAGYTTINVVGLALGIAACLLIALFVRHELSYDDFHADADRIHRVVWDYGESAMPAVQWPAIEEIRRKNPSLTMAPFTGTSAIVGHEARQFREDPLFLAGPAFFDVFTFPLRRGVAGEAFERPYTAVLTPEKAQKYFGDQDPVGKTLEVKGLPRLPPDTTVEVTVAGVLEPIPEASHFHPEVIVSWATLDAAANFTEQVRGNWTGGVFRAYLTVPEGTAPSALAETFTEQIAERAGDQWDGTLRLQALTDIHLHSDLSYEIAPNGSAATVYVFGFVALVILVLAGVNFVNLALARAAERTQEVGVRKSIGATRGQVAGQFLAEALLLAGGATALAVGLAVGALPVFRAVTGMEVTARGLADPFAVATLLGIALLVAIGSAAYPAFVLSRHSPAQVLGGRSERASGGGGRSARLRRGLVVFQFVVAVALGAGTIAAYWQLNYLQEADLGFQAEQVVTLPMPPAATSPSRSRAFQREVTRRPGVEGASKAAAALPVGSLPRNSDFSFGGLGVPEDGRHNLRLMTVGTDFFDTMGVDVLAGRGFEPNRASDTTAVVVNRAAFQQLVTDLPPDARAPSDVVGRTFGQSFSWLPESKPLTLIGVVENAHLSSLRRSIAPVAFSLTPPSLNDTYYLRVDADNVDRALRRVKSVWRTVFPQTPFTYSFTDRAFAEAYRAERRTSTLISVFAGLALAIACLGLFGLAAVAVRQRRQEIGIRKAVGASTGQIVALFSTDFVRLVGIAIAVAVPLAYVALSRWLDTFAYHIDLGAGVFLIAGGGALAAALLAVSVQAVRAARTDPAAVLRNE